MGCEPLVIDRVVSTIEDMARLAETLLCGSAPGIESMKPIDGVATAQPNRTTGMFWVIGSIPGTDDTIVVHKGRTGGYSAFFALFRRAQRAVIVLENASRGPQDQQRVAFGLLRDDL
jgi:CubicO group peptidase (beta-lactamase class C family)